MVQFFSQSSDCMGKREYVSNPAKMLSRRYISSLQHILNSMGQLGREEDALRVMLARGEGCVYVHPMIDRRATVERWGA